MYSVVYQGLDYDPVESVREAKLEFDCDHMLDFEHDNHTTQRWICRECKMVLDEMPPVPEVPYRTEILATAGKLINGQRQVDYGPPSKNFERVAEFWSTYMGHRIEAHDVTNMMALLKIARAMQGFTEDTYVDAAGYIGIAGELHRDASKRAAIPECTWSSAVGQAD